MKTIFIFKFKLESPRNVVPERFPSIVDDNKLVAAAAATRTTNPIEELSHDHRELNGLLVAVHEALQRVDKKQSKLEDELHEIGDGIEAFREHLLDHFAREQEGLLPFVVSHLPRFKDRSETLIIEHDRIAESLTQVVTRFHGVTLDTLSSWRKDLTTFEDLYATHTKSENAFLDEVAEALSNDRAATDKLRDLINA